MSWTIKNIENSKVAAINQHLLKVSNSIVLKKHKYGAKKTVVNDIEFDSIKEANRYKELLLLLKAGSIGFLELQVPYELNEGGTHSFKYYADFVYTDTKTGEKVVEDVKPMTINKKTGKPHRTKDYIKKRRLMLKIYNIKIKEV